MGDFNEVQKKIILLGDGAVGKTSLIRRFVTDKFDDSYIGTIGSKVTAKTLQIAVDDGISYSSISGVPLGISNSPNLATILYIKLQIWDILGQKGYTKLYHSSFKGTDGVFLVADITRKDSLNNLESYWIPNVKNIVGTVPSIILVNKSDLTYNAEINEKDLGEFAKKYKVPYLYTSAKSGENVKNAFFYIGKKMLEQKRSEPPAPSAIPKSEDENLEISRVIDRIIDDFCKEYGKLEIAMPIIRKQFQMVELDINRPTRKAVVDAIERLAIVEDAFKKKEIAEANRKKRLGWLSELEP
jgi:Ras-related protein Rab-1A